MTSRRTQAAGWLLALALVAPHLAGSLCAFDCLTAAPAAAGASEPAPHHCGTAGAPADERRVSGVPAPCSDHSDASLTADRPSRGVELPRGVAVAPPLVRSATAAMNAPRPRLLPDRHAPPGAPTPLRI